MLGDLQGANAYTVGQWFYWTMIPILAMLFPFGFDLLVEIVIVVWVQIVQLTDRRSGDG